MNRQGISLGLLMFFQAGEHSPKKSVDYAIKEETERIAQ